MKKEVTIRMKKFAIVHLNTQENTAETSKFRLFTKITQVNLSAFIYRQFHEDFFSITGTNPV